MAAEVARRVDSASWMGEIPEHWDIARLKYVAKLGTGHTPSRQKPEYWVDGERTIPWVTLADVWQLRDGGRTTTISQTAEKITPTGLANSAAVLHSAGTVILSRTASVGFSAVLGVDAATSQDFMTWTCGPRLEPLYLLYVLRAMQQEFRRLVMGSTHKTIYMPDIERLTIPLPPLDEQKAIGRALESRLGALDSVVNTKTSLVALLHERLDAEVTSAVLGDPAGGAVVGTRREAAPVSAYLRRTPPDWMRDRLKHHVQLNKLALLESTAAETVISYIDISTVDSRGHIGSAAEVTFAEAPSRARRIVSSGDTIVSTVRTYLKAIARITPEYDGNVCSTGFAVLTPCGDIDSRFLYYWTRSVPFVEEVRARSVGVSYPAINPSDLVDIGLALPSLDAQRQISDRLDAAVKQTERLTSALDEQLALVHRHRDSLILNAVTGRLQGE